MKASLKGAGRKTMKANVRSKITEQESLKTQDKALGYLPLTIEEGGKLLRQHLFMALLLIMKLSIQKQCGAFCTVSFSMAL
jgi:hypothetical protein